MKKTQKATLGKAEVVLAALEKEKQETSWGRTPAQYSPDGKDCLFFVAFTSGDASIYAITASDSLLVATLESEFDYGGEDMDELHGALEDAVSQLLDAVEGLDMTAYDELEEEIGTVLRAAEAYGRFYDEVVIHITVGDA